MSGSGLVLLLAAVLVLAGATRTQPSTAASGPGADLANALITNINRSLLARMITLPVALAGTISHSIAKAGGAEPVEANLFGVSKGNRT